MLLPEEYQEVEYIESTGTQYIDTGYYWTNENVEINFDGTVISNPSSQSLFGNEENTTSSGNTRNFSGIPHGSNGTYRIFLGSEGQETINAPIGTRFKLDIRTTKSKSMYVYKDNSLSFSKTYSGSVLTKTTAYTSSSTSSTVGNIFIFANHNSERGASNASCQNISDMKLYSFKMHDNDELIRDFVPCYRKNDNVIGLYDRIDGKFYTNQGTGTFIKGGNVDNSVTSTTQVNTNENHTLIANWTSIYVSPGLVLHLDAINNAGNGHSNTTTSWKDLSGKNNDAIFTGLNRTTTSGWNNDYLALDGVDDYGVINNSESMKPISQTIEILLNRTGAGQNSSDGRGIVFVRWYGYTVETNAIDSNNKFTVSYGRNPAGYLYSNQSAEVNKKNLITATHTNNKSQIYLNSIYNGEQNITPVAYSDMNETKIGMYSNRNYTKGYIYSIRMYNRALSTDEIQHNYNVDKNRFNL